MLTSLSPYGSPCACLLLAGLRAAREGARGASAGSGAGLGSSGLPLAPAPVVPVL